MIHNDFYLLSLFLVSLFSSLACQTEGRENLGFAGDFPARTLTVWWKELTGKQKAAGNFVSFLF